MGKFKSDKKYGSGGKSGGFRPRGRSSAKSGDSHRFGRGASRDRKVKTEMYRVTCDKCGSKCEVPFRPTEGKPVYCSDCFGKKPAGRPNDFEDINKKLDKILKILGQKNETIQQ